MFIYALDRVDSKEYEMLREFADPRECQRITDVAELTNVADGLILIGSYENNPPLLSVGRPEALLEFLQATEKPVLTLGYGFELLCAAYGIDLESLGERGSGAGKLEPNANGSKVFQGEDPICIAENERWLTDEFPKKLQILARSNTGVEAVRHKTRPLFGLQQCPQDFTYPSDAKMIYQNIFTFFDQYNSKH